MGAQWGHLGEHLGRHLTAPTRLAELIGESRAMCAVRSLIDRLAASSASEPPRRPVGPPRADTAGRRGGEVAAAAMASRPSKEPWSKIPGVASLTIRSPGTLRTSVRP